MNTIMRIARTSPHRKSIIPHPVRPSKRKRIDPIQQRMALRAKANRAETSQEAEENDWQRERRRLIRKNNQLVRLCRKWKKRCAAILAMNEERNAKSRTVEDDMRVASAIIPVPGMGVAVRGKMMRT